MKYRRDIQPNALFPGIGEVSNQLFDVLDSIEASPEVTYLAMCRVIASAIMHAKATKNPPIGQLLELTFLNISLQVDEFMRKDAKDREQAS